MLPLGGCGRCAVSRAVRLTGRGQREVGLAQDRGSVRGPGSERGQDPSEAGTRARLGPERGWDSRNPGLLYAERAE
ncbi:hypothetical protein GCM10022222_48940 [Amycolatopsis ultiminotia]|uniref:Uncharacterized protein n=1 Tax=Amycolatopsis ultiminotia TaxID=543629 RepID=A0ABP6X075_9PSEU